LCLVVRGKFLIRVAVRMTSRVEGCGVCMCVCVCAQRRIWKVSLGEDSSHPTFCWDVDNFPPPKPEIIISLHTNPRHPKSNYPTTQNWNQRTFTFLRLDLVVLSIHMSWNSRQVVDQFKIIEFRSQVTSHPTCTQGLLKHDSATLSRQ